MTTARDERASYRAVLAIRDVRALFLSELLSVLGDQVARIAVALIVFERTGSAFAAAATYGCSFLTWLVGGPLLSTLSDRYPRRELMIAADLGRLALVLVLCVGGLPLWAFFAALAMVGLLTPPFEAARSALLADIVEGEQYVAANALSNVLNQGAQVGGYLLGGVLVAGLGARGTLAVDAATFALSAALLVAGVGRWPRPMLERTRLREELHEGVSLVFGSPELRGLLVYASLAMAVLIVPEGLAVATAGELHRGAVTAGLLTATMPAGFVVGTLLLLRVRGSSRATLFPWLLLLCCMPLLLSPLIGSAPLLAATWTVAGAGGALQVVANAQFMAAVPAQLRGRAFGIASTCLMVVQGLAVLAAGAVAESHGSRGAVGLTAALTLAAFGLFSLFRAAGGRSRSTLFGRRSPG